MGTAEFEYAVGINLLALESRALSTLFFPSSSVILYSNLFIILSTSLMTNENATDDAQGSADEPPSFRNTTPAVTPSALSPNGTQRRLQESIPLSPRRQRIHRTHGSRSENSVSVPGSTPGLFPFHGVVPDWPQSSLQPFAMPLTPQTPHIGTVHAGSTVSQVVHPSWP